MSYDLNFFVPQAAPPLAEIRQAVALLGLPSGERGESTHWWIDAGITVHIDLWPVDPRHWAAVEHGHRWRISISANVIGRLPPSWSVQFVLPYILGSYLPDGLVEDPQTEGRYTAPEYFSRHRARMGSLPYDSVKRLSEAGLPVCLSP